ncbi:MAG: ABC transporter permease [Actinomycetota bacterium]
MTSPTTPTDDVPAETEPGHGAANGSAVTDAVEAGDGRRQSPEQVALGRRQRFAESFRQFRSDHLMGFLFGIIILLLLLVAIAAPIVATHDPSAIPRPPQKLAPPSGDHLFGTDQLGRDIFSRVVYGARTSLIVATATVVISTILGTLLGAVSGYLGGWVDLVIQRIVDAVLSIPVLILALFIASLLGASITNVVLALSIIYIPRFSRIARGEMLRIRSAEYVTAAEALGAKPSRIIFKHGVPNLVAPIIVLASLTFGQAIVAEAALSFLGVGAPITEPSWGRMLSTSREFMTVAWWSVVFPGAALSLGVLAFNLFGDALRDHLDPKLVR